MTGKQTEEEAFDQGILQAYDRLRQRDGSQFRSIYTEEQIGAAWKESREPERKGSPAKRRGEIERERKDLKKPECQECGTGQPKHPSTRPPVWSSAANLLFEKGLRAALGVAGNLHRELFRFLVRFCVTFPECKQDLLPDVARAYRDGPSSMLNEAAIERPLCHPETLRFLRAYLEGDDPLWKWSLSTCARRMGWLTKDNKPDHARVREILREYGIKHGMKGKPGRPKK